MHTPPCALRLACALALTALIAGATSASAAERPPDRASDRWIVVYEDGVHSVNRATDNREKAQGFRSRYRYSSALKGFAARLDAAQVRALRRDPKVAYVAPDRPVRASGALLSGDNAPNGTRRIEAATTTAVRNASGEGVAIIDTGIDFGHPDLKAATVNGKNCIDTSKTAQDDHGHGTHVAGTVAAANNGTGVAGVAPGTALHAVKVLDANGSGSTSSVICGINWAAANAGKVGVVNLSLGGTGSTVRTCSTTTDPQHDAICKATAAGVVHVVAAGNDGFDFDDGSQPKVPAAYPEVVTVTAMADTNGLPGAGGSSCGSQYDDRYASFSNYASTSAGAAHTVAGPGVCVVSDKLGGGTASMSGTSMATPHVAGAIALCLSEKGGDGTVTPGACASLAANDPARFIDELTRNKADTAYGFYGDPDTSSTFAGSRYYGFLAWAPIPAATSEPAPPSSDTTAPAAPAGLSGTAGDAQVSLDWADNGEGDLAGYNVYRRTSDTGYGDPIATGLTTSAHVDGTAVNGTTYLYVVRAVDTSGNVSAASNEISATPKSAFTSTDIGLTASTRTTSSRTYVDLAWTTGATGWFEVFRNGSRITITSKKAYTDKLRKSGTYTYQVCVYETTTCSNEVQVTR